MRFAALAREVLRNILTGTARVTVFGVALALVSSGLALADLASVRALEQQARAFQDAGASIITLVAPGRIDGRVCESLATLDGVRAAGAIRESKEQVRALALPGAPLQTKDVTVGFPALLTRNDPTGAGVVLVRNAADQLGLAPGDTLHTSSGEVRVAGVFDYPDDGRRTGLGYAALLPTVDAKPFDECWVDAWPAVPALPALIMTTVTPSTGARDEEAPALGQLNTRLGAALDGPTLFAARVTASVPLVALAAGLALGFLSVRLRRMQLASALHSRVRRSDLHLQVVLETGAWVLPAFAVGLAVCGFAVALGDPADHLTNAALALRVPVTCAAAALAGATLALTATRERHLFRYFKDR